MAAKTGRSSATRSLTLGESVRTGARPWLYSSEVQQRDRPTPPQNAFQRPTTCGNNPYRPLCPQFGTKRPWVRIPPPRHPLVPGQEPSSLGSCSVSGPRIGPSSSELQQRVCTIEARTRPPAARAAGRGSSVASFRRASRSRSSPVLERTERPQHRRALARYLSR